MELTDKNGKPIYQLETEAYEKINAIYQGLNEENYIGAYTLAKTSKALEERFSEIRYLERKSKSPSELKDRTEEIYKVLRDIHTHCRMVWARGKETPGVG